MGKFVEKLQHVGQATNSGFGFMGRSQSAGRKPRPAAIFVALRANDSAAAEAVSKAGSDGVLITGWTPGGEINAIKTALGSSSTLWGVEYTAKSTAADGVLKAAADAGAAFALIGADAPASVVFDEVEQLDLVVTVDAPNDDLALALLRAENLLPAQAAMIKLPADITSLDKLTVHEFARLRLVVEAIRFPTLVTITEIPKAGALKALVRLGVDGILLAAVGSSAEALGRQVQTLGEMLEAIPVQETRRSSVAIGGFMTGSGEAQTQRPGKPAPDPDEE